MVSVLMFSADHSYFSPQKQTCNTHVILGHEVEEATMGFHPEASGSVT